MGEVPGVGFGLGGVSYYCHEGSDLGRWLESDEDEEHTYATGIEVTEC